MPVLRELGWDRGAASLEARVTKTLETLTEQSLISANGEMLQTTEQGRAEQRLAATNAAGEIARQLNTN